MTPPSTTIESRLGPGIDTDPAARARDPFRLEVDPSGLDVDALRRHGARPALISGEHTVTFAELADRIEHRAPSFGVGRRLVVAEMGRSVDAVVDLLTAFHRGDVVALGGDARQVERWADRYGPDLVVRAHPESRLHPESPGTLLDHRTPPERVSVHELHDDLALLLSTSGSTGAPKLVRLSRVGVESNAHAIARYLGLSSADRAITALPLHYCYGLSVLTSHLVVGAGVVLDEASVVDPCFWAAVDRHRVTGLAVVPHSLDLVDRLGREVLDVPSLRYVTQAGGRLEPERVRAYAELGARYGWDFFVMYGQTEATARMAYLPPDEAVRRPASVGRAIPGGTIHLDTTRAPEGRPDAGGQVGEVVYRGPNVMMGYAERADDLARGHEHAELRTGDLGRFDADGYLEIVGRASRFVKIHGKRIDLDHLEQSMADAGFDARCVGDDEGIVAAIVDPDIDRAVALDENLRTEVATHVEVPRGRIAAVRIRELPLTSSGKLDGATLLAGGRDAAAADEVSSDDGSVTAVFESVLGRRDLDPDESFATLGGDSFSYVEASIRLESLLGGLPSDWHLRPLAELDAMRPEMQGSGDGDRRRWGVQVETSVVLRAIGILLIVCTHMRLYRLPGGAHLLLAVVGYNFARFQLAPTEIGHRLRRVGSTIARVAVPTSAWIGINMALVGGYSLGAVLLINNYTGEAARRGGRWEYWYFEAFVQIMVVLAILFSIGSVRRAERRAPFAFALAILAATLAIRFDVVQWGGEYNEMFRTHTVACFVALGWCAYRCRTVWHRLLVTGLAVVTTVGYFGQTDREWRIIVAIAALVWLPTVRIPRRITPIVSTIAAASMWIFLVHWQVWPLFTPWFERHVAFAATIVTGVGVWWLYERIRRSVVARRSAGSQPGSRHGADDDEGVRQSVRRLVGRSTSSQVSVADTVTSTSDAKQVTA